MKTKSIVVLSGGQDSVTCLGVAMKETEVVAAVTFMYGQKHIVEINAARDICHKYGVKHIVLDMRELFQPLKSSALISHAKDIAGVSSTHPDLPASFVPARNALFLTAAFGLAIEMDVRDVYAGVCQTDYSGYPDCRAEFVRMLNDALIIGYQRRINFVTPLMYLNKAETFALAEHVGMLADVIERSVTCYNGDVQMVHDWGKGCGECPACKLRANGYAEYIAQKYQRKAVAPIGA